jgi:hypothetical protein
MTSLNALYAICFLLFCIACLLLWIGNNIAQISKLFLQALERSDPLEVTHQRGKNDFD